MQSHIYACVRQVFMLEYSLDLFIEYFSYAKLRVVVKISK